MFIFLFFALLSSELTRAAFTQITRSSSSSVEQNSQGTWCFYPQGNYRIDTACTGNNAQFSAVIDAHVAQGNSISYYSPSLQRLGGAEYPVKTTNGQVYLCLSGRTLDGQYVTQCETSVRDNSFGSVFGKCALDRSQIAVTDGCYEPGVSAPKTSTGGTGTKTTTTGTKGTKKNGSSVLSGE